MNLVKVSDFHPTILPRSGWEATDSIHNLLQCLFPKGGFIWLSEGDQEHRSLAFPSLCCIFHLNICFSEILQHGLVCLLFFAPPAALEWKLNERTLITRCKFRVYMQAQLLSRVQLFKTPWTTAHQASLYMDFSRQEYWSGFPFPPPGNLLNPGIKPTSLCLLLWAGRFFTRATWEAHTWNSHIVMVLLIPVTQ